MLVLQVITDIPPPLDGEGEEEVAGMVFTLPFSLQVRKGCP
ncbi:MAG: hypothetical protein P8Z71_10645 [Candidatus Sulfobium sp.]